MCACHCQEQRHGSAVTGFAKNDDRATALVMSPALVMSHPHCRCQLGLRSRLGGLAAPVPAIAIGARWLSRCDNLQPGRFHVTLHCRLHSASGSAHDMYTTRRQECAALHETALQLCTRAHCSRLSAWDVEQSTTPRAALSRLTVSTMTSLQLTLPLQHAASVKQPARGRARLRCDAIAIAHLNRGAPVSLRSSATAAP